MHRLEYADLVSATDQVAEMLLARAHMNEPPIDALELARRLDVAVVIDTRQQVRARQKRIDGHPSVFLRPEARVERYQWAIAHEIAEHAAYHVFRLAGVPPDEVSPQVREQAANQLASRLLMPSTAFAADVARFGYDLIRLKGRYATASYESIAIRLLALPAGLIVTVFDHSHVTSRRTNLPGRVPPVAERERQCWQIAHDRGESSRLDAGPLNLAAFPIHEPDWKREILLTRVEPEFANFDEPAL